METAGQHSLSLGHADEMADIILRAPRWPPNDAMKQRIRRDPEQPTQLAKHDPNQRVIVDGRSRKVVKIIQ